MATINMRLSPKLEDRARLHADELGISINALVSVAVDSYFRVLDHAPRPVTRGESTPIEAIPPQIDTAPHGNHGDNKIGPPGPNASKKERQAYTAFQRSQRKLPL